MMNIRNEGAGFHNAMMNVGNDGTSIHDAVTDAQNNCACIYCKFSLGALKHKKDHTSDRLLAVLCIYKSRDHVPFTLLDDLPLDPRNSPGIRPQASSMRCSKYVLLVQLTSPAA